jgi:DNA (cytosine-5)-methyltransferase 1
MTLNAGGMGRIDAETETLIATTGGVFDVAHSLKADGFDASEDGTGRGTPIIAIQGAATRENPSSGPDGIGVRQDGAAYTLEARQEVQAIAFDTKGSQVQTDETGATPTLRSMAHDGSHQNGGGQLGVAFAQNQRNEIHEMAVAGALPAEPGMKQQTYVAVSELVDALHAADEAVQKFLAPTMAVRRLTPLECTRLQGFPDDYFNVPGKPFADGPIYKMLGNSMAVNCMTWIGQRIQSVKEIAA